MNVAIVLQSYMFISHTKPVCLNDVGKSKPVSVYHKRMTGTCIYKPIQVQLSGQLMIFTAVVYM